MFASGECKAKIKKSGDREGDQADNKWETYMEGKQQRIELCAGFIRVLFSMTSASK